MYGTVPFSARSSKVLKVSAKGAGIPSVKARRDNVEVRMDAAILRRKEFTVAFRFMKHNNGSTKFNTTDTEAWINKLNWIFGAQANIYFKLLNATWVTIPKALGSPMTSAVFKSEVAPHKNASADLTCFLVGRYKGDETGVHAAGTYFRPEKVCVLDDGPHQEFFDDWDYDSLLGVMAHEFGHFLKAAHHSRGPLLMSRQIETCDLDKQIVSDVNPW